MRLALRLESRVPPAIVSNVLLAHAGRPMEDTTAATSGTTSGAIALVSSEITLGAIAFNMVPYAILVFNTSVMTSAEYITPASEHNLSAAMKAIALGEKPISAKFVPAIAAICSAVKFATCPEDPKGGRLLANALAASKVAWFAIAVLAYAAVTDSLDASLKDSLDTSLKVSLDISLIDSPAASPALIAWATPLPIL